MGILRDLGEILPGWLKTAICVVVTVIKVIVVLFIVAAATHVLSLITVKLFLAFCIVGGVFTGGVSCILIIILIILMWIIFVYMVYKIVKKMVEVIAQEHCTVFQ